jgi:hypothetical protein
MNWKKKKNAEIFLRISKELWELCTVRWNIGMLIDLENRGRGQGNGCAVNYR